jgi:hypothetical protein
MTTPRVLTDAVHMSPEERALFERVLAGGVRRYMEFGAGGSTLLALRAGAKELVVIDSDPAWAAALRRHPEGAAAIESGRMTVLDPALAPIGEWGYPVPSDKPTTRWPRYLEVGWAEWARRATLPDLVLVDGRFRVACCLSVLLTCPGMGVRVLVHDITPERPYYSPILRYFDVIAESGGLSYLSPRPLLAPAELLAALLVAQFDPR